MELASRHPYISIGKNEKFYKYENRKRIDC